MLLGRRPENPGRISRFETLLRTSAGAIAATAPIVARSGGVVGFYGLLCNLVAVPWMAFILLPLSLVGTVVAAFPESRGGGIILLIYGYPMCIAIPLNAYLQVRSLLKKSMPENRRKRGFVAVLRSLGTVVAFLLLAVLIMPGVFLFFVCAVG